MDLPFLFALMAPLAERHGITFDVEPAVGHAARLVYPDGTLRYVRSRILDLNLATSASVARGRAYLLGFLKEQGVPVPEFLDLRASKPGAQDETGLSTALEFADATGYPVAIRSFQRSGRGPLLASTPEEVTAVVRGAIPAPARFLLQRVVSGHSLTLVVMDHSVPMAFLRQPDLVPIQVAEDVQALAIDVVRRSGLRFAAVDLILDAPDRPPEAPWYVLDVVPDPDLEPYARLGEIPRQRVEALVEELLLAMGSRQEPRA